MKNYLKRDMENSVPKVLITFRKGGENGGPYQSHQRIMESSLKKEFKFIPWMIDPPKRMLRMSTLLNNIRFIKKVKPDIIHFSGLQLEGFAVLATVQLAGFRNTVCAVRGSSLMALNFPNWKKRIVSLLEKWTIHHSSKFYGVSKFVSEWEALKGQAGACGYVYNLPNFRPPIRNRQEVRQELKIPQESIVIISTARIVIDKGYDVLTKAIVMGREKWQNVRFLIVGDGSFLPEMKDAIRQNGLEDIVVFTGYRDDIPDLLAASDVFALCTYHETLCNAVLEASYYGLPVLSTNVGGIPEIVQDGVSGYLLSPGDAESVYRHLIELTENRELREAFGRKGKQLVGQQFSEETITKAIQNIYHKLI